MIKRNITYEDFDGVERTEPFYFNLSKSEIVELEVEIDGGLSGFLRRIVETSDHKELVGQFKRLILLAYGIKSDDGKSFKKNEQLREDFAQTAAFDALFMELSTNANSAAEWVNGVIPKALAEEAQKEALKQKTAEALTKSEPTTAEIAAQQAQL